MRRFYEFQSKKMAYVVFVIRTEMGKISFRKMYELKFIPKFEFFKAINQITNVFNISIKQFQN